MEVAMYNYGVIPFVKIAVNSGLPLRVCITNRLIDANLPE